MLSSRVVYEFSALLRHQKNDIEATLVLAVGSHDNMTSTGRVLFSKGDSSSAPPPGEIANYEKQLDNDVAHHSIGPRNNNAHDIACCVMIIERNSVGARGICGALNEGSGTLSTQNRRERKKRENGRGRMRGGKLEERGESAEKRKQLSDTWDQVENPDLPRVLALFPDEANEPTKQQRPGRQAGRQEQPPRVLQARETNLGSHQLGVGERYRKNIAQCRTLARYDANDDIGYANLVPKQRNIVRGTTTSPYPNTVYYSIPDISDKVAVTQMKLLSRVISKPSNHRVFHIIRHSSVKD
ncbi:hypothetical protein WN51_04404 [Melipona quadrifasciata]|uniref:Uncharacterized protein n=1 Tax=Melipona quadrifasciata TaxID=166423 RepID=A0A0M8ZUA7_9HYME|nr:hypothetical protein WN51_04404 [Melipona quadrifasciata]